MTSSTSMSVVLAGRRYRVVLPRLRDPRLHVAAVIISVQVAGQAVLDFDVSITQILVAVGTAAALELVIGAVTEQQIAWPASALLSGNGVALLLRVPGTEHGDWWSSAGWPIFAAAAGISVLSKYAARVGDRHLFNPSNLGLVVVFLTFGSSRAEPQDLWWGPWRPGLVLTLAVIVVGGLTLSRRLGLFAMVVAFWATFATAIGALAVTGHAITARWHVGPVAGWEYWWILVSSPEIVIFVFFMITDPRTSPDGHRARMVYAASVALIAGVLAGLQRTEFATKVSLLLALTLVCAARPLVEHWTRVERDAPSGRLATRVAGTRALAATGLAVGLVAVLLAGQVSEPLSARSSPSVAAAARGVRPDVDLPDDAVPVVTVDDALDRFAGAISVKEAQRIGRDLVEGLVIEAEGRGRLDPALASQATFGPRLAALEQDVAEARSAGRVVVSTYRFDRLHLVLLQDPVRPQAIPQLGLAVTGSVTDAIRDLPPSAATLGEETGRVDLVFLLTEVGEHYLIGDALGASSPMVVGGSEG